MATEESVPAAARLEGEYVSPCDEGSEVQTRYVIARPGQRVEVRLTVCGTPALAVVHFGEQVMLRQRIEGAVVVPVLAPPHPSDTLLVFGVAPLTGPWKAKGEVILGDAVLYCHKKNSLTSQDPTPKWVVMVRVIP